MKKNIQALLGAILIVDLLLRQKAKNSFSVLEWRSANVLNWWLALQS